MKNPQILLGIILCGLSGVLSAMSITTHSSSVVEILDIVSFTTGVVVLSFAKFAQGKGIVNIVVTSMGAWLIVFFLTLMAVAQSR